MKIERPIRLKAYYNFRRKSVFWRSKKGNALLLDIMNRRSIRAEWTEAKPRENVQSSISAALLRPEKFHGRTKGVGPFQGLAEGRNPFFVSSPDRFLSVREVQRYRRKVARDTFVKMSLEEKSMQVINRRNILKDMPDVELPEGVVDQDFNFFTSVAGRKNKDPVKMDCYREQMVSVLQTRLVIGFKKDSMYRTAVKYERELKLLENTEENFRRNWYSYNDYLDRSAAEVQRISDIAKEEHLYTVALTEQKSLLSKEFDKLVYDVGKLYKRFHALKQLQHGTYQLLDTYLNTDDAVNTALSQTRDDKSRNKSFRDTRGSVDHFYEEFVEGETSREKIINPEEYVPKPVNILQALTFLEMDILRQIQYITDSDKLLHDAKKLTEDVTRKAQLEIHYLTDNVTKLKGKIEQQCKKSDEHKGNIARWWGKLDLQDTQKILDACNVKVTQMYESIIGKESFAGQDCRRMFARIEKRFLDIVQELDNVPREVYYEVRAAKRQEDKREAIGKQLEAEEDKRTSRFVDIVIATALPPYKRQGRPLVTSCQPRREPRKEKKKVDPEELKRQEEYNYFFT